MEDKDFQHYLHCKRWVIPGDEERVKLIDEKNTFHAYQKMWIEGALDSIEKYEKAHPEWKVLGDKEHEEFWKKSKAEVTNGLNTRRKSSKKEKV